MKRSRTQYNGFSLVEALVAMMMAVMALIAVFAIYDQVRRASVSITRKLDSYVMPSEILQKIAEDIDRIAGPGSDAKITIVNSFQSGLPAAQLTIASQMLDKDGKPQLLEKVVWQTDYDLATARLVLYRSHSGLIWEDNLLDREQRADWTPDRQLFVPLCAGLSYFKVQVPQQQNLVQDVNDPNRSRTSRPALQNQFDRQVVDEQQFFDVWNQPQLPPAIMVTLSFAAPVESGTGGAEVPDDQKIIRTIMIDRSKKMNFVYVSLDDANRMATMRSDENQSRNPNAAAAMQSPDGQGQNTPVTPDSRRLRRPRDRDFQR
jgi:hypothetical protein